jgi:hypothetical protein
MASNTPAILTPETVPAYLKSNYSNLVGVLPENAEFSASPIFGGNVNYGIILFVVLKGFIEIHRLINNSSVCRTYKTINRQPSR